jgi:hypothetical protein
MLSFQPYVSSAVATLKCLASDYGQHGQVSNDIGIEVELRSLSLGALKR